VTPSKRKKWSQRVTEENNALNLEPGGETDPAGMEIDLWVRSKAQNTNNCPPFETFVHLCWEEVTWR